MRSDWSVVMNILYIFIFMISAKILNEKLHIFKSLIMPTSLFAGLLGLLAGPEVLKIIDFDLIFYESMVFHFLAVGFISLTLSERKIKQRKNSVNSGLFILATYCFQAVLGMTVVFLLIKYIKPDLFIGFGLMLPLAYGQGPGFATAIGSSWQQVLGFGYEIQFGLTLATAGFFTGGFVGLILLNYYAKKYNLNSHSLRKLPGVQTKKLKIKSVTEINFFDMLTVQISLVAAVYFATYYVIVFLSGWLTGLGQIGETIGSLIKGFNYLFGIIIALLLKIILEKLEKKFNSRARELVDEYFMHNIASLSFNVMITCSVMAISIVQVKEYWELLLSLSLAGALFTLLFVVLMGRKSFSRDNVLYTLAMFGMLTGTASTGLALLRGLDPDLESDVAKDLVLGSAIAAPLGIPLMIALSQPVLGYKTGNPCYYWITFAGIGCYMIVISAILIFRNRKAEK